MKVEIGEYTEEGQREVHVRIDPSDTWGMDHTLAHIIAPMLVQLNETKHGAPFTDDEDVPEALKSTSAKPKENEWDTDEFHFDRWGYIMQEMLWGFTQIANDYPDEPQMFKHIGKMQIKEQPDGTFLVTSSGTEPIEGARELNKAYNKRINNATRLFGKYYRSLWD